MMSSYPPTSLCATRYASLPIFDLSVGGGGGGDGGGGGGGIVEGNSFVACSPLSPVRSWEEHIREISRELHAICGSPRSRTSDRLAPLTSRQTNRYNPPTLTRHLSMGCVQRSPTLASTPPFPPPKRLQTLTRTESHDRFQPAVEAPGLLFLQRPEPAVSCHHRLVVRHEETPSRLNEQLARVCLLKSDDVPALKRTTAAPIKYCEHRHSDSAIVKRQTSSKTGVLYKVPLDQRKPEELFVNLVDDRLLRICADDGTGSDVTCIILEEVTIPTEVPVQSLVLSVADDRWLYVQERSGGTMVADFSGTSAKYLPVVRENEAASQVEIFLRIPVEFEPDEILVKTVDDRVVVTGSRRPVTVALGDDFPDAGQNRASPLTIGHSWPPPGVHFVVIIALPSGSENRTVTAYFTQPHQLMITGRLRPNLRRYTF